MDFGKRMKEIRKDLGLKQKDMAERLHVSLSTLQRYEKGQKFPNIEALLSLIESGYNIQCLITGYGERLIHGPYKSGTWQTIDR